MARFKLKSKGGQGKAPKLTKAQTKILRKFGANARDMARRMKAEARRAKSEIIKEARETMGGNLKGKLVKVTSLNTWTTEQAKERARVNVTLIKRGPNKGMFRDRKTKELVSPATVNRRSAAYRYHANVRHIQNVLKGSYAQARKAYKAFLVAGILKATEFES